MTAAAIRAALIDIAETATGLTAHPDPDQRIEDKHLPALAVLTGGQDEDNEYSTLLSRCFRCRFAVVALVAGSADPGAAADGYAAQVRAAVEADPTLGGAAIDTIYAGEGEPEFDLGDCAQRRLNFDVIFS